MSESRSNPPPRNSNPGKRPRVLAIYKKSAYQINVKERKNARMQWLLSEGDRSVDRLIESHEAHEKGVEEAQRILNAIGAKAVFRYRSDAGSADDYDLVVSLGGDGTLLWASHLVGSATPVVAINTAPLDSVGHFCAGSIDEAESVLRDALLGKLSETTLTRMRVDVDGEMVATRVLNDMLFAHECAAATTRYLISQGDVVEDQKSSGIWVGPAAGSTAARHSAGGEVMPIESKRLQYVVREPMNPAERVTR